MKRLIIFILRLIFLALILLPLILPNVAEQQNFQNPRKVTVFVPAEVSLQAFDRKTLVRKVHDALGASTNITIERFGRTQGSRILDFEELGSLVQRASGAIIVYAPSFLWGAAASKFAARIKETKAFKEERFFWLEAPASPQEAKQYLGVEELFLPNMSFLGEESIATVEIVGKATANTVVSGEIVFRTGESLLTSKTFSVTSDSEGVVDSIERVPLTFVRAGTQILSVTLNSPLANEYLATASTTVVVTHSKATLLHVAVGPDWSLRNLRQKLKFWPNLDLLSYYILREFTDDMSSIPNSQLSLIEFPTEKLFGSELPNFHGIIAQNFPFDSYLDPKQAKNLVNYVRDGGRLALIAGPLSFDNQDADISTLSPCLNTPRFDTDTTYTWEPADSDVSGNDALKSQLSFISSHATAVECDPKPGALVLARTQEGKHPVLIAYPVDKGLVLAILSGDWHTHYAQVELKTEADAAHALLTANAVESLFQWMVEFLQRRQDGGLRPPDLVGPRIYSDDDALLIRGRGLTRLDKDLELQSDGSKVTTAHASHLNFLDFDIAKLERPLSSIFVTQSRELSTRMPLQFQFAGAPDDSLRSRAVNWPVLERSVRLAEMLPNPILARDFPALKPLVPGTPQVSTLRSRLFVPLLEAYPWILAAALAVLALEQFLSHILWRHEFHRERK